MPGGKEYKLQEYMKAKSLIYFTCSTNSFAFFCQNFVYCGYFKFKLLLNSFSLKA